MKEQGIFRQMRHLMRRGFNRYRYMILAACTQRRRFRLEDLRSEGYCSQSGQDKWIIEKLFPGKKNGVFVDVGAFDGITFSNTYILEKMGWNGLAIEPMPSAYEKLVMNRRCATVNGCVAPASGRRLYRAITGYLEQLSGLADEYDPRHMERITREIGVHGGNYTDIEVECYNLNKLLEDHGTRQVDYLSIDVEGLEYKILEGLDVSRFHVSVIGVENNFKDWRTPALMKKKGFAFHSIVGDEFYRNRRAK